MARQFRGAQELIKWTGFASGAKKEGNDGQGDAKSKDQLGGSGTLTQSMGSPDKKGWLGEEEGNCRGKEGREAGELSTKNGLFLQIKG